MLQPKNISSLRVTKKLAPTRPGAIKLAERYGANLVCVRHRVDTVQRVRVTTVELVVDCSPLRASATDIVGVRIGLSERDLQQLARAAGAWWDREHRVWRMQRRQAKGLGMAQRIVENDHL